MHWVTHPRSMQCANGHAYSHPKQGGMSLYFGDKGVLTLAMVCHRCQPATYCFGVIYNVQPIPLTFFYSCADKETFSLVQRMDADDTPLESIVRYLNEPIPRSAA